MGVGRGERDLGFGVGFLAEREDRHWIYFVSVVARYRAVCISSHTSCAAFLMCFGRLLVQFAVVGLIDRIESVAWTR